MPKPSSQPTYTMASSVLAARSTSGRPRHTGAASTATTASSSVNVGTASGSSCGEAAKAAVTAVPAPSASQRSTGRPACSSIRTSSQRPAAEATTTSALNRAAGALRTMSRKIGSSTAALARRFSIAGPPGASKARPAAAAVAISHPTEATASLLEVRDRPVEVDGAEVRPQHRRHPQLRVGDLPQQEVGDPHLAAGPDQEVGVRNAVGVERAADVALADLLGRDLARPHLPRQRAEGVQELVAAAVVEGHQQREAGVGPRLVHDVVDAAAHRHGHTTAAADHAEAHVALHQLGQLAIDRLLQEPHQRRDLVFRPIPVLRRERVERQVAQPDRVAGTHQRAGRLHALAVPGHTRQPAARRPPPVAVHDDRDVGRHRLGADQRQQLRLTEAVQRGRRRRPSQNERISCSFFFSSSSTLAMNRSVVFWTWSWARRSSSSDTAAFLSLAATFSLSLASRRTLRTATRASSAILATVFTSCFRRSSVGVGMTSRMSLPSFTGCTPRSDLMMAFSMADSWAASHGWTTTVRASGVDTEAIWLMGVGVP